MIEPPRLSLAKLPTPLEPMRRISKLCGINIWIKRDDLTDTVASGNKIRKLEFSIAQAMHEDASVLITCGGVQSNHCRATAILASRLGLRAHLVLRGQEPKRVDGNLLIAKLAGASIDFVTPAAFEKRDDILAQLCAEYTEEGEKPFTIPAGATDEIGLWGYIECARELKEDFKQHNISPGALVSATGSGGTLGGLIIGNALFGLDTEVLAFNVCDDADYFVTQITNDFNRWQARYQQPLDLGKLPIQVIDGYVGPGYGRATDEVYATIRNIATMEGIILDPVYTAKAFHAMLQEITAGRFAGMSDIVFIHTGGIFGLFPQAEHFFN